MQLVNHPLYNINWEDWARWRSVYRADSRFRREYLHKLTHRESNDDFRRRLRVTYVPPFAKKAINKAIAKISRRFIDIIRVGGSDTYQSACNRGLGGVDMHGSSMNYFMTHHVLSELMKMGRVGVYVDMPPLPGPSKLDKGTRHPYLYSYPVENILNWTEDRPNNITALHLLDDEFDFDLDTGLPLGVIQTHRLLVLEGNKVLVRLSRDGNDWDEPLILDMPVIPFAMPKFLDHGSPLGDVADYQIALLNMASADIAWVLTANFPFYTEQFDRRWESEYLKGNSEEDVDVGTTQGRRYPIGTERPAFINPSSEPLKASMAKQEQLKQEIEAIINDHISNIRVDIGAGADIQKGDIEAGLQAVGSILEATENQIAGFWALYEGRDPATVLYPNDYATSDSPTTIDQYLRLVNTINSSTFRRVLTKEIARSVVGPRVSADILRDVYDEIDEGDVVIADPDTIRNDLEAGIVDPETASLARGYPSGVVLKAKIAHAERLARIQAAQSPRPTAQGMQDLQVDPREVAKMRAAEKVVDTSADLTPRERGDGRAVYKGA